jgi:hypothetical protein
LERLSPEVSSHLVLLQPGKLTLLPVWRFRNVAVRYRSVIPGGIVARIILVDSEYKGHVLALVLALAKTGVPAAPSLPGTELQAPPVAAPNSLHQ